MAVERKLVVKKKGRKIPIKQYSPSHPVTVSEAAVSPEEVGTSQKQAFAFEYGYIRALLQAVENEA